MVAGGDGGAAERRTEKRISDVASSGDLQNLQFYFRFKTHTLWQFLVDFELWWLCAEERKRKVRNQPSG